MGRSRWGSCRARGMVCMDSTQRPERCGRLTPISAVVNGQQDLRPGGQAPALLVDVRPPPVGESDRGAVVSRGEGGAVVHGDAADGLGSLPGNSGDLAEAALLVEDLLDRGQVPQGAPALPGGHGGVGGQAPARGVARPTTQGRQHVVVCHNWIDEYIKALLSF